MRLQRQTKTPQEWTRVNYIGVAPVLFILLSLVMVAMFEHMAYQAIVTKIEILSTGEVATTVVTLFGSQILSLILAMGIVELLQDNHKQYLRNKHNSRL